MKAFKQRIQDVIKARKSGGGGKKESKTLNVNGATITVED
jgi:hypothetical protein